MIPQQKLAAQTDLIECESHRDVLIKVLNEQIEK